MQINDNLKHVAIIMDGNGRWAKKRHLPRAAGHIAGVKAVEKAIQFASKQQFRVLTLFALSTENFTSRPDDELTHLMELFVNQLQKRVKDLHKQQIKVSFIGDHSVLPSSVQSVMQDATALTENNSGLQLVFAINYSGQWDITQAAQRIAKDVSESAMSIDDVSIEAMSERISLHHLPPLDLLIRTSGELRISNFLLWQIAYSELYFTDTLWPDFNEQNFEQAVASYFSRSRKYGKTPEQLENDGV